MQTCRILLAALAVGLAQQSIADVTEKVAYSYYTATAQPGQPIKQSLNQASPNRTDGRIFHAYTRWNVSWHFWTKTQMNGMCRINRVQVTLDSTINLPSLVNATPDQDAQFGKYFKALNSHEQGHVDIGRQAALAINDAIMALPDTNGCSALNDAANDTGHKVLNDFKQREIQYDVLTQHGRTQGAILK
jgi:predicted secreted Zn-dependent protease